MRAISAAEDAVLNATGGRRARLRVSVKDSGGTFRDLGTYPGRNLVQNATWGEDVDSNGMDADITLKRECEKISAAPLMTKSPLNLGFAYPGTYAPLIDLAREVKIEVAVLPEGIQPAAGDWKIAFQGYIDDINPGGKETMTVRCSGLEAKLRDTWIERERSYGFAQGGNATKGCQYWRPSETLAIGVRCLPTEGAKNDHFFRITAVTTGITASVEPNWPTGAGATVVDGGVTWTESGSTSLTAGQLSETIIQQILDDNLGVGVVTLVTPVSPAWAVKAYRVDRQSVWAAVRALADEIGWDLRFRWDEPSGSFKLTFSTPDRAKVIPDRTFKPSQRYKLSRLQTQIGFIRNAVQVVYNDSGDLDEGQQPKRKVVQVTDATSITQYGRRFCEVAEAATANIDSSGEATTLANNILSDLAQPRAEQECDGPLFRFVELSDLIRWKADGIHYDSDQDFAVVSYHHHVGMSGQSTVSRTTMVCRGKPSTGFRRWLARMGTDVHALDLDNTGKLTVVASDVVGGTRFQFQGTQNKKSLAPEYELHVSTVQGFTPSSASLKGSGQSSELMIADLIPGKQHYARVVPLGHNDRRIVRGRPGPEFPFVPGRASSGHISQGIALGAYPLNGGFETRLDAAGMPDHWTLRSGTLGSTVSVMEDANGFSGTRYMRLSSSSTGSIQSAKFPILQEAMEANRSGSLYRLRWWRKAGASNSAGSTYDVLVRLLDASGNEVVIITALAAIPCDNKTTHWVQEEAYLKISAGNSTARDAQLIIQGRAGATFQLDLDEYRAEFIGTPWYEVGNTTGFTDNYESIPAFAGTWVNFGNPYATVAFRRDQFGRVYLKGIAKSGAVPNPIFTLPVGFRPQLNHNVYLPVVSNNLFGIVEVHSDGRVLAQVGNTASFSLDNISFMTTALA
jgi:hypothetical protein